MNVWSSHSPSVNDSAPINLPRDTVMEWDCLVFFQNAVQLLWNYSYFGIIAPLCDQEVPSAEIQIVLFIRNVNYIFVTYSRDHDWEEKWSKAETVQENIRLIWGSSSSYLICLLPRIDPKPLWKMYSDSDSQLSVKNTSDVCPNSKYTTKFEPNRED